METTAESIPYYTYHLPKLIRLKTCCKGEGPETKTTKTGALATPLFHCLSLLQQKCRHYGVLRGVRMWNQARTVALDT